KGRTGKLLYYRNIETSRVAEKVRIVTWQPQKYFTLILDRVYYINKADRKFNLGRIGLSYPYKNGHIVMIYEYVYDFCEHYIQEEGLALSGQLLSQCYSDKNWCYPDLTRLEQKMGKSTNTVNKNLKILKDYGFVYTFLVQSQKNNKMYESPLYK
ncbi:helix-turn-helix domain-containing protein, partial [Bacillus cereus]|uniref:helix-turn-helix domain-containing protein n=1 Tax=Bacillus cereus TaxID=1396 RepID=UPI002843C874